MWKIEATELKSHLKKKRQWNSFEHVPSYLPLTVCTIHWYESTLRNNSEYYVHSDSKTGNFESKRHVSWLEFTTARWLPTAAGGFSRKSLISASTSLTLDQPSVCYRWGEARRCCAWNCGTPLTRIRWGWMSSCCRLPLSFCNQRRNKTSLLGSALLWFLRRR